VGDINDCYAATDGLHSTVQTSRLTQGFSTAQTVMLLGNTTMSGFCIQLDTLYIHKQLTSAPTPPTQLGLLNTKVQAATCEEVLIMTVQNSKVSGVAFMCTSTTYLHDFMKPTKSSSVRCPKTHWHHITSYVFGSGEKS
jgi:hypothetical protein